MTTTDLETAALWAGLPSEVQSHAWALMTTKHPYEALRVLVAGTGSGPKARRLVAWLSKTIITEVK